MIRLPWGRFEDLVPPLLNGRCGTLVGALSFEERCLRVPQLLGDVGAVKACLLRIEDPEGAFPDYTAQVKRKMNKNLRLLRQSGVRFSVVRQDLLAMEDHLLRLCGELERDFEGDLLVLDISSLPKRYFAFIVKRFVSNPKIRDILVCYTMSGDAGYTPDHLASDPLPADHLPGFAPSLDREEGGLVVSVGFESLGLQSILDVYHDRRRQIKFLLPFPPGVSGIRRQWGTLREFAAWEPDNVDRGNIEAVGAWDVEQAFAVVERWYDELGYLSLAPFGAKTHSLAMVLFAIANDAPLFYTQPQSYHPEYSLGVGHTWAYVVKWDGVPCFDRNVVTV